MLVPLGDLQNRVKVYQATFKPIPVALRHRVSGGRPSIDLAAHQSLIDLRPRIAGDKFWVFQSKNVNKKSTFTVRRKDQQLASDPDSGSRRQFLYAAQARLLSAQK